MDPQVQFDALEGIALISSTNATVSYHLEVLIGKGGFSAVYRAQRLNQDGPKLAVKVFETFDAYSDERAMLERLMPLACPYLVRLIDAGVDQVCTPFLRGCPRRCDNIGLLKFTAKTVIIAEIRPRIRRYAPPAHRHRHAYVSGSSLKSNTAPCLR